MLDFAMRVDWRQAGIIALLGFLAGALYRYGFDPPREANLANYFRSGLHGVGLALVGWGIHLFLLNWPRLVRLPFLAELATKSIAMTIGLAVAAATLQSALYGGIPDQTWLSAALPRIVAYAFVASLILSSLLELSRLIGPRVLVNFVLGRYHRPIREERIFMFLDLVGSTRLAEKLGEVRVHDLITRFFFDIDSPIVAHGGEVHAYVGDAAIITWPLERGLRDARCVACFFAIEEKIAQSAAFYQREFGVVPQFSAALHAGAVVVSECGNSKRQIAYFGDTVNVAARLQEEGKVRAASLVASASVLKGVTLSPEFEAQSYGDVRLRGREAPIELFLVRHPATANAAQATS